MTGRCILLALAALLVAGAGFFVLGRWYEISAIRQHPGWIYSGIVMVRDAIVAIRANGIEVPPGFSPEAGPEGVALYEKHCAECHGAPGFPPRDFALGMMPVPTNLVHAARGRPPEEIHWFIRYGLKMSGMPAWHGRMSEADMWRLTATVEALPRMTPAGYARLLDAAGGPLEAVDPLPTGDIPQTVAEGDPQLGRLAMQTHACRSCHIIPGMVGPDVHVGPSLAAVGSRAYIAGVLRNTPENMVRWIMDPKDVDPLTTMPDLRVTRGEARHMAAYLYSMAPDANWSGPEARVLLGSGAGAAEPGRSAAGSR